MGETYSGSATTLPDQRTDQMMILVSITLVVALVVGGFVVAANIYGDQDKGPIDNDQQIIAMDRVDPAGTAPLQASRAPDFVMESESSCWGPLYTEQGTIDFYDEYLPEYLPLCVNTAALSDYYVDVVVHGGYTPAEFASYINVWQKTDFKGRIDIQWTKMELDGDCCATFFRATFYVVEDFCLDSSQYPSVNDPWEIDMTPGDMIPDKEVYLKIHTEWSGCVPGGDQDFTIIQSQSYQALSKRSILIVKPNTFCKHLERKQSVRCYSQTALVQAIFEPKKNRQWRSDRNKYN
ncbi:MAG: hypothetical protein EAX87_11030 [Candidatus Thorarchaeota archaeon]|nr:hypothetical protein [Candidatus Thorarchaeota archaeon]